MIEPVSGRRLRRVPSTALRWLLAGLLVQCLALSALFSSVWPPLPSEEDLLDLGPEFEVVDEGTIECGMGLTAQCGWEIEIRHDGSEAELVEELERVNLKPLRIEDVEPRVSRAVLSWIESDSRVWAGLGVVLLCGGIALTATVTMAVFIWTRRKSPAI